MSMEVFGREMTAKKVSGDGDGERDAMGVRAEPTPAASSIPGLQGAPRSVGNNANTQEYVRKNALTNKSGKAYKLLGSGSGSGDPDGGLQEEPATKKKRNRRGRQKHRNMKPYSRHLSFRQKIKNRHISRLKTGRQPPAPYNTTQFLMADHDLPDIEQKLSKAGYSSLDMPVVFPKPSAPPRTRDSSFSVDSDEDYFYSSPEDEEEFLTKEFSTTYDAYHAERLGTLSKTELIQEYLQLETKLDLLSKRLRSKNFHQIEEREVENNSPDTENAKKLKMCQQHIDDLMQQIERLTRENERLRTEKLHTNTSESSVDSERDSDSSNNSNQSRHSCPLPSPGSSPHKAFQPRLDTNTTTDTYETCETSQCGSSTTSTTPAVSLDSYTIMNETDSFPT